MYLVSAFHNMDLLKEVGNQDHELGELAWKYEDLA